MTNGTSATLCSATRTAATPGQYSAYAAEQIDVVLARATDGGEDNPDVETVMDRVAAPLLYRILFRPAGLDGEYARRLVVELLDSTTPGPARCAG